MILVLSIVIITLLENFWISADKNHKKISKKKLIYSFTSNGNSITDLRVVAFIQKLTEILESLENEQIKEVYFVFDIDKLEIPSNFAFLARAACFFTRSLIDFV